MHASDLYKSNFLAVFFAMANDGRLRLYHKYVILIHTISHNWIYLDILPVQNDSNETHLTQVCHQKIRGSGAKNSVMSKAVQLFWKAECCCCALALGGCQCLQP